MASDRERALNELAWSYRKQGDLAKWKKLYAEAAEWYREEICVRRQAAAGISNARWTSNLAVPLGLLGDADMTIQPQDVDGAQQAYFEAMSLWIKLMKDDPSKPLGFRHFDVVLKAVGEWYKAKGNPTLAAFYDAATEDVASGIEQAFPAATGTPQGISSTQAGPLQALLQERGAMAMINDLQHRAAVERDFLPFVHEPRSRRRNSKRAGRPCSSASNRPRLPKDARDPCHSA